MKIRILLVTLMLLCAFAEAQVKKITIEPNHSTIGFSIPIAGGVTKVFGKFTSFDLKMDFDTLEFQKSSLTFTIDASSIDTGIEDRDAHLRTADFFDVEKYPSIVFTSSAIESMGHSQYIIKGELEMHGVSKDLILPFTLLDNDGKNVAAEIRHPINRLDFGVGEDFKHSAMENFLGENIDLMINFWTKSDKR